jgi:hypothetical protein
MVKDAKDLLALNHKSADEILEKVEAALV